MVLMIGVWLLTTRQIQICNFIYLFSFSRKNEWRGFPWSSTHDRRLVSVCYLISESNTMILKIIYIVSSRGVCVVPNNIVISLCYSHLFDICFLYYYNYYYYHSLFIIIVVADDIIYNIYIVCITYAYVRAHVYILYVQYIQQRVLLYFISILLVCTLFPCMNYTYV